MSAEIEAVLAAHCGLNVDAADRPLAERVRKALDRAVLRGEQDAREADQRATMAAAAYQAAAKELSEIDSCVRGYSSREGLESRGGCLEARVENLVEHIQERFPKPVYFVVWCPAGGPPSVRHDTQDQATKEAERLARESPGREFVVLGALTQSQAAVPPVVTKPAERFEDIPF